jgi:hypothetical protein
VHVTTELRLLNQVEIWFNRIAQQANCWEPFRNVKESVKRIDHHIRNSNRRASLFIRTVAKDSIFTKLERLGIPGSY